MSPVTPVTPAWLQDEPEPCPLAPPALPHDVEDVPPVEGEPGPEPRTVDLGPEHGVWRRSGNSWFRLAPRAARQWRRAPTS